MNVCPGERTAERQGYRAVPKRNYKRDGMKTNAIMLTIAALAMALLAGCTQEQVLASLEASVAATETLVASLEVAGKISPTIADEIENAIADLPAAFSETAAELSSRDNAAARAAKIAGYYSATVVALRALPPEAQVFASAISASIQAFLSGLQPAQATRSPADGAESGRFNEKRLNAIATRAAALGVQLAELKANAAQAGEAGKR
jgi:hypothetical protein